MWWPPDTIWWPPDKKYFLQRYQWGSVHCGLLRLQVNRFYWNADRLGTVRAQGGSFRGHTAGTRFSAVLRPFTMATLRRVSVILIVVFFTLSFGFVNYLSDTYQQTITTCQALTERLQGPLTIAQIVTVDIQNSTVTIRAVVSGPSASLPIGDRALA